MVIIIDTHDKLESFIKALSSETKKQGKDGLVDLETVAINANITNGEANDGNDR